MTDDALAALRSSLKASARLQAEQAAADRKALWERLTASLPTEWERVAHTGNLPQIDAALNRFMVLCRTRKLFRLRQKELSLIKSAAEDIASATAALGARTAMAVWAVSSTEDCALSERASAMLDAAADAQRSIDGVILAIADFADVLPRQQGAPVVLSDIIAGPTGKPFHDFAEIARDAWRTAGLSIGGNGVEDQGFGLFLDAVHLHVVGRKIPGRATLLAALRNTWPSPRIR